MAKKKCDCNGTGNCQKCDGDGYVNSVASVVLTLGLLAKDPCKKCNTQGKCTRCDGRGAIPDDKANLSSGEDEF